MGNLGCAVCLAFHRGRTSVWKKSFRLSGEIRHRQSRIIAQLIGHVLAKTDMDRTQYTAVDRCWTCFSRSLRAVRSHSIAPALCNKLHVYRLPALSHPQHACGQFPGAILHLGGFARVLIFSLPLIYIGQRNIICHHTLAFFLPCHGRPASIKILLLRALLAHCDVRDW